MMMIMDKEMMRKWGLNIIEESQDQVYGEVIYITEEEENNEVDYTYIENNDDNNVMNETNDGISAAEENDLGEDTMQSEERD